MAAGSTRRAASHPADDAFVHLFDVLPEGVYIGLLTADTNATLAANPHLRLMFGWTADVPLSEITPLAPDRFVDEQARTDLLQQFRRDGHVQAYLLRLRRVDGRAIWVEMTGARRADRDDAGHAAR